MIPNLPDRTTKALRLARTNKVQHEKTLENGIHVFKVRGTGKSYYLVFLHKNGAFTCECGDFQHRNGSLYNENEDRDELTICKHIQAVIAYLLVEQDRISKNQAILHII